MLEDWLFRLGQEIIGPVDVQILNQIIKALERRCNVASKPRRKIALPTHGFRFLKRTIWLLSELVADYAFIACPGALVAGVEAIHASRADLCWAFYPFGEGVTAQAAFHRYGIPYVVTNRGVFWRPRPRPQAVTVLADAAQIVSLSNTYARQFRGRYPPLRDKRVAIISNGVAAPSKLPPHKNCIRRSFVSAVNVRFSEKRAAAEELIQAFSEWARGTNHVLTFAVSGTHPSFAEGWHTENVLVTGFVRDIFRFLTSGHVFLYSSRLDSQPSVLMEAMFAGLPCVVLKHVDSGAWEFAPQVGVVNTMEELLATGQRMLIDKSLQKRCCAQGAQQIASTHTWRRAATAYKKVFADIG